MNSKKAKFLRRSLFKNGKDARDSRTYTFIPLAKKGMIVSDKTRVVYQFLKETYGKNSPRINGYLDSPTR